MTVPVVLTPCIGNVGYWYADGSGALKPMSASNMCLTSLLLPVNVTISLSTVETQLALQPCAMGTNGNDIWFKTPSMNAQPMDSSLKQRRWTIIPRIREQEL
jgi:hypothetical protein